MKRVLLALVSAVTLLPPGFTAPLPPAAPAGQRMPAARLARVHDFLRSQTASGYLGAVTLVARDGRLVDWQAHGHRDLARTEAMPRDAIFRIYSMTKTVTAVAVLTLLEDGRLGLDDPVGLHLPQFASMQEFAGGSADAPQLRPARRPITIRHLLTHTPGFAVYGSADDPVNVIFNRARLSDAPDLASYVDRLARLPLAHAPGEAFHYDGVPTQVLGRLVEVLSGMPLDRYFEQRIFDPLRMTDTGFEVPGHKRPRIADMTTTDAAGKLSAPAAGAVAAPGERTNRYFSAAGGLYSTASDYARFTQMLLGGGQLDGVRILGRKTVELMLQNHLPALGTGLAEIAPGEGFGLGGSVVLDPVRRGRLGSPGQFGWSGAAATYYTIDPREKLVAILMLQHLPQGLPRDPPKLAARYFNLVYQSLDD